MSFDANSHERFAIGLPDGDANPKNGIGTFFAEYGEVGRLDPGAAMDDSIEFPMGFDCVFLFHGAKIPKKLSSEAFAAFIEANGVDEFYLAGADATACVKSTSFNMAKAGYRVHVLSDCVTSYDKSKISGMLEYYQSKGCFVETLDEALC